MTVSELLDVAKNEIQCLESGETFSLKDLFKGYIWNRIDRGTRSQLGTSFLIYVDSSDSIERIGTQPNSQRKYKKL